MANKNQYTAEQFIDAIKGSGGIVTAIARRVGCDWHTAKKYIDTHVTVKRAYNAECEGILDLAETKLFENVKIGDMGAIKYILSTKGKNRGYTERQEITGKDGEDLGVSAIDKLTRAINSINARSATSDNPQLSDGAGGE